MIVSELDELENHIRWAARRAGVYLLALCRDSHEGFQELECEIADTFYGIQPEPAFNNRMLHELPSYADAIPRGIVSSDFPEPLWNRALSIAADMKARSKDEGFEFYNGHLARFSDAFITEGKSPLNQVLHLRLAHTSHFTSIGTNQHFTGYKYQKTAKPHESPLSSTLNWAHERWQQALRHSPLANTLAIHLMLYNDYEILYVCRGKVGTSSGFYNSTVNGVVEFTTDKPRSDILSFTAANETAREIGLTIEPSNIRWLACGVTTDKCQPFLSGACRVKERIADILPSMLLAPEQREIRERSARSSAHSRLKDLFTLPRRFEIAQIAIGVGLKQLHFPYRIVLPYSMTRTIRDKVLNRCEFRQSDLWTRRRARWHQSGAATLLLTLAHMSDHTELLHSLRKLRRHVRM